MNELLYPYDETFMPQNELLEVANSLQTPFYLFDEAGICESMQQLRNAFSWNEGFRQFFPLRRNRNAQILKILHRLGSGVRCCNLYELRLATSIGFTGEQVQYAPMFPQEEALRLAVSSGATVILDNMESAVFCIQNELVPCAISFQYNSLVHFPAQRGAIVNNKRSVLGMTKQEILRIAPIFYRMGVKKIGLSFCHVRQTCKETFYGAVAKQLIELSNELLETPVAFCDLGGGIGLSLEAEEPPANIAEIGRLTKETLESANLNLQMPIHIAAGRAIVGAHGIYISKVLCVKKLSNEVAVLDAAAAQFPSAKFGAYHHVSVAGKTEKQGRAYYDIIGCTPETNCKFMKKRLLPQINAGDYCVMHTAGFDVDQRTPGYDGETPNGVYIYGLDKKIRS